MASIVPMTVSSILIRWAMIAVSESYSVSQKKIRKSSNESKMQSPHTTTRDGRRRQKGVMTSCKTYVNSSHSQLEGTNSRTKTAFLGTWIFTNRFLSNLTFNVVVWSVYDIIYRHRWCFHFAFPSRLQTQIMPFLDSIRLHSLQPTA